MNRRDAETRREIANCKLQIFNFQSAICNLQFAILQSWIACYIAFLSILLILSAPVRADIDAEQAVSQGAEALDSWWDYPWYDDQTDGVRRINVKAEAQQPAQTATNVSSGPSWDLEWLGWLLLVLVVLGILVMLLRTYWYRSRDRGGLDKAGLVGAAASVDRLEELPFPVAEADGDLLSAARRASEQGRYDQAIVWLYSHQLLELDRREDIRLTKGKTNRQYLRELRPRPQLASLLNTSMVAFEDVFFGGHTLGRERFEECWRDAMQLLAASEVREAA
jgi:hypothetical protein